MNTEIRQLIKQSFLSQKHKGELLDLFVERGGDEEFFKRFNIYLAEEFTAKSGRYQEMMGKLEEGSMTAEAQHAAEEELAMKKLEQALKGVALDDIAGKQVAWDDYYMAIERSERTYERSLRGLAADMIMAH